MGMERAGLIRQLGIAISDGTLELVPTDDHTSAFGVVHLSVLTALAEGSAWLRMGENAIPISLTAHFVKTAKVGDKLTTEVTIISCGRTIGVADANVMQNGQCVAGFRVSFFFMENKP